VGLITAFLDALFDPSKDSRNRFKGAAGEAKSALGLGLFLPDEYIILNNITLPTDQGTTQIDHIVVSPHGIHVVEGKAVNGTIYGSADDLYWTAFLGGKKHQLHNPLIQNRGHIKALMTALALPESAFHSVVFFSSEKCRFKTRMPENVLTEGLIGFIKREQRVLFSDEEVTAIIKKINHTRLEKSAATDQAHIANVQHRFQAKHRSGDPCPVCAAGKLVPRTAKASGAQFLGCERFPRCRYRESL